MKLLMITGDRSLAEGKRGAFYNTLEEFHKYWDRIDIICPKIRGRKPQHANVFGNVFIHPSPWQLILQPVWILKKGKKIYREHKFNIMTVHEYPPFYNGIGARLLWNKIHVPYILEIHHVPGYPKAAGLKELFYKLLTHWFIKYDTSKSVAVRVVNRYQVPKFLVRAGVPAHKIKYIPAGYIDLQTFRPIPVDKKYDLVFAARLEKNKGIANLVEAIKIAKKVRPDIKLLIIGNGPERERLRLQVVSCKLQDSVSFSGWLATSSDVAMAYNSARAFINPSFNEGGPRVLLEAMACGLPVITTPVGLAVDLMEDGQNGILTDWNPNEIARKVLYLLDNQVLQEQFKDVGLKIAQGFSRSEVIKNYAQEIKSLTQKNS